MGSSTLPCFGRRRMGRSHRLRRLEFERRNRGAWLRECDGRSAEIHNQRRNALCFFATLAQSSSCRFALTAASRRVLRVCADPNNLPFSNQAGEGLENRLAELVAAHLEAELQYVWWAERKSFLRNSLQAGLCDVVMGVPSTLDSVSVTRPYYQSTYVFVERTDRHLKIASLNDPRLEQLKIGIHIVGDDYAPPAHLLARRGLASQLAGYSLYGPLGEPNPPRN